MTDEFLDKIYERRWNASNESKSAADVINREAAWNSLVKNIFQKFVNPSNIVLDLGCGPGDFINRIKAQEKYAIDLDPNNKRHLSNEVKFYCNRSNRLTDIPDQSVDLVFTSNLFEHLQSVEILFETLSEVKRIIKLGDNSLLIVMMPNANKVGMKFYDFIDHKLPLTEMSLVEALEVSGFRIVDMMPGFFPYSAAKTKFRIPKIFFDVYLRLPIKNRPFAGQMLCIAKVT